MLQPDMINNEQKQYDFAAQICLYDTSSVSNTNFVLTINRLITLYFCN